MERTLKFCVNAGSGISFVQNYRLDYSSAEEYLLTRAFAVLAWNIQSFQIEIAKFIVKRRLLTFLAQKQAFL